MNAWLTTIFFIMLSACANAASPKQVSNIDICKVIQLTINLPKLQQYYHIAEKPERKPLKLFISDKKISCTSLTKFNEPVILLDSTNNGSYMHILNISPTPQTIEVSFTYKAEGIKGLANFKKQGAEWQTVTSSIVEQ